jgi:tetratricopeptide (TPR) repeat protein
MTASTSTEFPWKKHIGSVHTAIEKNQDAVAEAVLNVLLDLATVLPPDASAQVDLVSRLGYLQHRAGNVPAAQERFSQALKFAEDAGLSEDQCISFCLDGLADCHQSNEDFDQSEKLRQRAVVIADKALGAEHPSTGYLREKLQACREERNIATLGSDEASKTLFDKLCEQQQANPPVIEETPAAAPSAGAPEGDDKFAVFMWEKFVSNGNKELAQKNLRDAEGAFKSAVEKSDQLKPSDPRRCETLCLLAHVLEQEGKIDEAIASYEKALTIAFNHIGGNTAETARCMQLLGDVFSSKADFGLAKNYYKQASNAFIISVGRQHPDAVAAQEKLAWLIARVKEEKKWGGWSV